MHINNYYNGWRAQQQHHIYSSNKKRYGPSSSLIRFYGIVDVPSVGCKKNDSLQRLLKLGGLSALVKSLDGASCIFPDHAKQK